MVAYSFQSRFQAPIVTRRKTGTIRNVGHRRHAQPGDALQLYTGMRTRSCRLVARAVCAVVEPIRLCFGAPGVIVGAGRIEECRVIDDLDAFAQGDGFADWAEMADFWAAAHPLKRLGPWVGLWVRWNPETVVTP